MAVLQTEGEMSAEARSFETPRCFAMRLLERTSASRSCWTPSARPLVAGAPAKEDACCRSGCTAACDTGRLAASSDAANHSARASAAVDLCLPNWDSSQAVPHQVAYSAAKNSTSDAPAGRDPCERVLCFGERLQTNCLQRCIDADRAGGPP